MYMATWLLQNKVIYWGLSMRKFGSNCLSQVISQVMEVIDLYSSLTVNLETVVYFILFQEISALPNKTQ